MRDRLIRLAAAGCLASALVAGCGSAAAPTTTVPTSPSAGVATTATPAASAVPTPTCVLPQNNGGDHDADNNGGPDDGDGCER